MSWDNDGWREAREYRKVQKPLAGTVADPQSAPTATSTVTPKPLKTDDGDGGRGCLHAFPGHTSNEYASPDRLCDHCGRPSAATDPLRPWDWSGRPDGIWLHSRCEELWFDSGALAGSTVMIHLARPDDQRHCRVLEHRRVRGAHNSWPCQ
jgi:hypothetical protein